MPAKATCYHHFPSRRSAEGFNIDLHYCILVAGPSSSFHSTGLKPYVSFVFVCSAPLGQELCSITVVHFTTMMPTKQEVVKDEDKSQSHDAGSGNRRSTFRSFYMCRAGGAHPCCAVIPMESWHTTDDKSAWKPRWYCVCCGARYQVKFGMIIEIEIKDQFYYVKAQIPPGNYEEIRADYLKNHSKWSSLEDLLNKLKTQNIKQHPSRMQVLRPMTSDDVYYGTNVDPNVFKITPNVFEQLQEFHWEEIMNFAQDVTDV